MAMTYSPRATASASLKRFEIAWLSVRSEGTMRGSSYDRTSAAEPSVEPLSRTMSSQSEKAWASTLSIACPRKRSWLYELRMIETTGTRPI